MRRANSSFLALVGSLTAMALLAQEAVQPADKHYQPVPKEQGPTDPPPKTEGKLAVEYRGAKGFKDDELQTAIAEQIKEIETQGLTKARADDAAFFLSQYYRTHGYAEAEVLWELGGPARLILKIKEGPVATIRKITFIGNHQVEDATLTEYLLGPTKERFPDLEADFPYVEADVQTGVDKVRGLYASQGYLKSTVVRPEAGVVPTSSSVDITLQISEGIKYGWGEVILKGDTVFSHAELLAKLGDLKGRPFTPDQVLSMQHELQYFYKSHGYFEAKVVGAADPASAPGGRVPVTFTIETGRQYRFGGVNVTGMRRLRASFLPNRFRNLQGQVYSPEKMQAKFRELMKAGLFKTLRMKEAPQPDGTVRLDLTAEEAKSHELGFSVGYNTFDGPILGVTWKDRDLFGSGRPLSIETKVSSRGLLGEVLYVDPWFRDDFLTERLRLYGTSRTFEGYDKLEEGFRAEFSHKFENKLEIAAFAQMRQVNISNVTFGPLASDVPGIRRQPTLAAEAAATASAISNVVGPTSYTITSVGFTQTLDHRDSPLNPTRGLHMTSSAEFATDILGKGVQFVRLSAAAAYFHPLGPGVIAFGARAGLIDPLGTEEIPVDDRFFNGGARSVRSFVERELGPTDKNGTPIGGDSFTVFNVEYTFPLFKGLEQAFFIDAGSVGTKSSFGTIREAVGLGLRYKTPVGPLRIDYGFNPSPRGNEASGALHISLGAAF